VRRAYRAYAIQNISHDMTCPDYRVIEWRFLLPSAHPNSQFAGFGKVCSPVGSERVLQRNTALVSMNSLLSYGMPRLSFASRLWPMISLIQIPCAAVRRAWSRRGLWRRRRGA
jgi:hypothetical protein